MFVAILVAVTRRFLHSSLGLRPAGPAAHAQTEQVRRRRRDSRLVSETLDAAGNTVDSRRDSVDSVGLGKMRTYEGETAQ